MTRRTSLEVRTLGRVKYSLAAALAGLAFTGWVPRVHAEVSEAAPRPDEQFDVMNLLSHNGLHDIDNESWNAYGQFTWISSYKAPFSARYTKLNGSPNSLGTERRA